MANRQAEIENLAVSVLGLVLDVYEVRGLSC